AQAAPDQGAAWPSGLGQPRREPQHPPVHGDVADLDAALGQQPSTSRYDRPKRRYQRTASTIPSGGKRKPANADRVAGAGRGQRDLMAAVSLLNAVTTNATAPLAPHRPLRQQSGRVRPREAEGAGASDAWAQTGPQSQGDT